MSTFWTVKLLLTCATTFLDVALLESLVLDPCEAVFYEPLIRVNVLGPLIGVVMASRGRGVMFWSWPSSVKCFSLASLSVLSKLVRSFFTSDLMGLVSRLMVRSFLVSTV